MPRSPRGIDHLKNWKGLHAYKWYVTINFVILLFVCMFIFNSRRTLLSHISQHLSTDHGCSFTPYLYSMAYWMMPTCTTTFFWLRLFGSSCKTRLVRKILYKQTSCFKSSAWNLKHIMVRSYGFNLIYMHRLSSWNSFCFLNYTVI